MSKKGMYARLISKGMLSIQTLLANTILTTLNLLTRDEILQIMGVLLYEGYISELDLDTFVTNAWITTDEKVVIISEKLPS